MSISVKKPLDLFSLSLCLSNDLYQIRETIEQDLIQKAEKKYTSLREAIIPRKCIRETVQKAHQVFERRALAAYSKYLERGPSEDLRKGYQAFYELLLKEQNRYFKTDLQSKVEAVFKLSSQKSHFGYSSQEKGRIS